MSCSKNGFFGAPFWGGFRWSCPKKFWEKKLRLQLNNFTRKLDFDVLWCRRRRAYKNLEEKKRKKRKKKEKRKKKKKRKKKEKKEKKEKKRKKRGKKEINLIAAKSGLVGMKGYLETYNSVKYFLPYLSRF